MNLNLANVIHKQIGETPLEALEGFRLDHPEFRDEPMTYAGRLDPMASGKLLILIGDECKKKQKYLDLNKKYEVEILFGITTDTYDLLGIAEKGKLGSVVINDIAWSKYLGKFEQEYPAYSSKSVNGVQLHNLARANALPPDMPRNTVEIFNIKSLGEFQISTELLLNKYLPRIDLVKGDFRQKEILSRWQDLLKDSNALFSVIKIEVECSSGTYMRSLANRIGIDLGTGAFALSIERTEILGM